MGAITLHVLSLTGIAKRVTVCSSFLTAGLTSPLTLHCHLGEPTLRTLVNGGAEPSRIWSISVPSSPSSMALIGFCRGRVQLQHQGSSKQLQKLLTALQVTHSGEVPTKVTGGEAPALWQHIIWGVESSLVQSSSSSWLSKTFYYYPYLLL